MRIGTEAPDPTSAETTEDLIPNGRFEKGAIGALPDGWHFFTPRENLAPKFELTEQFGKRCLMASGEGNEHCMGILSTTIHLELGKTYYFRVKFRMSEGLNPHRNLLFQFFLENERNGIFKFRRFSKGRVEGSARIFCPGEGMAEAQIRIVFRHAGSERVWIHAISLEDCPPVPPRWVRVGCTRGKPNLEKCAAALDLAGEAGCDLFLLPEYMRGQYLPEPIDGASAALMAKEARCHRMYVGGGIVRQETRSGDIYNTALLFDREGRLAGSYDKVHPYSPELQDSGVLPGRSVPIMETDFGILGFIICYDSWFTDVAELLALKGAEIILFPSAGFYRSLIPARSADNCVRIVASSHNSGYGIWDTAGREVTDPEKDSTVKPVHDIVFKDVMESEADGTGILIASLDLSLSPTPAHNGGTMNSAPGGRRNRREQQLYLDDAICRERERWWTDARPGKDA